MAIGIAQSTGLWSGSIWGSVETATSFLDSTLGSQLATASYQNSAAFTPGAITVDGLAVHVVSRAAGSVATMSVRLAQGGVTVVGTEVTINVSDLPDAAARTGEIGWVYFKFASPVLLVAATAYTLGIVASATNQVTCYRNATGANWSRMVCTSTLISLGAGDSAHVVGLHTGAGATTAVVVTMDSTAATDYGNGSAIGSGNTPGVTVGAGGTLLYGSTASTNYQLRLSTVLRVQLGGIFTVGTVGTPIPRNGTALLAFDCATDGDFGLEVFGTFTAQGLSRTAGLNVEQCLLNTDEAIGQTVLGVSADTGWLSGDEIVIASTSRTTTHADSELKVLNGNATSTTVTITVALASAHLGTSPMQAEVLLMTRNVRIEAVTAGQTSYVRFNPPATVLIAWVQFRYLGFTGVGKRGIDIGTTALGSCALSYCSARDFDQYGYWINGATADNIAIAHCVAYLMGGSSGAAFGVEATSGVNWSMTDCTAIPAVNVSNQAFNLLDLGGTVQRIRAVGAGNSTSIAAIQINEADAAMGDWSDWVVHSTRGIGIEVTQMRAGTIRNVDVWRCSGGSGLNLTNNTVGDFKMINWRIWGNATANVNTSPIISNLITFRGCLLAGDTTFATPRGLTLGATNRSPGPMRFENCQFSPTSGIWVPHSTSDIQWDQPVCADQVFVGTTLLAVTPMETTTNFQGRAAIRYMDSGGVDRSVYPKLGTIAYDTTVTRSSPASQKLTPSLAVPNFRLRSGPLAAPVASGATLNPVIYIRKDGSYVGSPPRLVLLANPAIGVDDDVIVASFSGAADTWVQVTGVTPAATANGVMVFVVEVDGAAGNVYLDDWA